MNAEEIRTAMMEMFSDREGPVEIQLVDKPVSIWLKRRSEVAYMECIEKGERRYSAKHAEFMTSELKGMSIEKFKAVDHAGLVRMALDWAAMEYVGLSPDLLDDLKPDVDETKEQKLEKRRQRYEEWRDERKTELDAEANESLVQGLVNRDAEMYARAHQRDEHLLHAVKHCVVDESGTSVFADVSQVTELPRQLMATLRAEVERFITIETEPTIRKVAESPDF